MTSPRAAAPPRRRANQARPWPRTSGRTAGTRARRACLAAGGRRRGLPPTAAAPGRPSPRTRARPSARPATASRRPPRPPWRPRPQLVAAALGERLHEDDADGGRRLVDPLLDPDADLLCVRHLEPPPRTRAPAPWASWTRLARTDPTGTVTACRASAPSSRGAASPGRTPSRAPRGKPGRGGGSPSDLARAGTGRAQRPANSRAAGRTRRGGGRALILASGRSSPRSGGKFAQQPLLLPVEPRGDVGPRRGRAGRPDHRSAGARRRGRAAWMTSSGCVPGRTSTACPPSSVSSVRTGVPRAAAVIGGHSALQCRSSPRRVNSGCARSRTSTYRSPGGPPAGPTSPGR